MRAHVFGWLLFLLACKAADPASTPSSTTVGTPGTIEALTAKMEKNEGYFTFYHDVEKGNVYLEVNQLNTEFLYVNSLTAGMGSNDIGLDRGQLGHERVVKFEKHGSKLLLIQPNYAYRAISDNPDEVKSVQEAFAFSVLYGFEIKAKTGQRLLIDFTDFLLEDAHGVATRLSAQKQGTYKTDKTRSALYRENMFNFPKNTEFEALVTFTGEPKGSWITSVAPTPQSVSVRMHHSLIELPDNGFTPREFDPRSGYIFISYQDYATPIDKPLVKRYIVKHRLEKKDPAAAYSEPVEPIVYYLDRGAPEPIRTALMEGAKWWSEAYEAAGFKDAFRVELLPEGAHPLDIRYNMIQWVHRSTRGWSYGASVVDPRTGEIIKGHVSLGSLRVRQDFLIAQGLLNQYDEGTTEMKEMALARLRQLAAHEVGHTIGLVHSYASSTNQRASVMDYPHPLVKLDENGNIDLTDAYDTGIGEWDKVAIRYGYAQFVPGQDEKEELGQLLNDAIGQGLLFITDRDARATDGAHPRAHLWDGGEDAADELNRMMAIRRTVLDRLSEKSLPGGEPYSSLEEILVPMYLFHRYQVEAAAKVIGGINYSYAVKGDNQVITQYVTAEQQLKALDALLATLTPESLKLPEDLLLKIPPKAHGYARGRETFGSQTGPVWDYYLAIKTATQISVGFLLDAHRANRLVTFHDRNHAQPGLSRVLDQIILKTWETPSSNSSDRAIQRIVEWEILEQMMQMAMHADAQPDVRSITRMKLSEILTEAKKRVLLAKAEDRAHYLRAASSIEKWLDTPGEIRLTVPVTTPDGSPIGQDMDVVLPYCSSGSDY
ncbi:MAG: zinc-dependent metalloprotease [Cyclobacteriaceae bacterium]|nr:zinc-dependent metalloprotease [Cyclobacteriaceae bacterium]